MIGDLFRGAAAVGLGTVALWISSVAAFPTHFHMPHLPAFLQLGLLGQVPSNQELIRRLEAIESEKYDHRLTVLETAFAQTAVQTDKRLESIENLLRVAMIGLVAVVFQTIWGLVTKIRGNMDG